MYLGVNCNQENQLQYGITNAGLTAEQRCMSTTELTTGVWYGRLQGTITIRSST